MTMTEKISFISFVLLTMAVFASCAGPGDGQNTTDELSVPDTTAIDVHSAEKVVLKYDDFKKFYERFISDSAFQMSQLRFPMDGFYCDYESNEIWSRDEWQLIKWDLREKSNLEDSTSIIQSPTSFFFGTYCLDCGFSFEMKFISMEGQWYMVYRQENNY